MERYEAYKDSGVEWIGEIPEGWEVAPLRRCITRTGNGITRRGEYDEEGTLVLKLRNINNGAIDYGFQNRMRLTEQELSSFKLDVGDFLFVRVNGSRDLVGKSAIYEGFTGDVAYNDHIIRISFSEHYCAPRFMLWYLQCEASRREIDLHVKTSAGQYTVSSDDIKECLFVMPSLQEQIAIARFLDAKTTEIDALVADCEREVELLREYRKAIISEAVTKGLDPNVPMKDSGVEWIGEIPKTWSIAKVKSCCDILPGYAFKSELFIQDSNTIKLLRGINLGVNVIRWDEVVSYPLGEIRELGVYRLLPGDVVIGLDRPWIKEGLRIAIVQDEGFEQYLVQRVARLRGSSELDICFVKYALESGLLEYELDSLTTGVSVPHISTEQIGSTRMALPNIATQREIIEWLDAKTAEIDALIGAKQSMADKLREYRRSLISEAVTGKFKVPGV